MPTQPSDYTDTVLELTLNDARTLRPFAEAVMLAVEPDVQSELEKINQLLRDAGFDYPAGARGVRDLINSYEFMTQQRDELIQRYEPNGSP